MISRECAPNRLAIYGAVEHIVLTDKVLHVRVTAESLAELELDDQNVEASLDVDDSTIDQLRAGLRRIMVYGRPNARPTTIEL